MSKLWPFSANVLFFSALACVLPFLILFYERLSFTGPQVGLLTGLSPLVTLVSGPLWTNLADRTHRHRLVLSLILLLSGLCLVVLPFLTSFWPVLAVVVVLSACFIPVTSFFDSATMLMLGGQPQLYGRVRLGGTLGYGLMGYLAGLLAQHYDLRWALWLAAALLLLTLLVAQALRFAAAQPGPAQFGPAQPGAAANSTAQPGPAMRAAAQPGPAQPGPTQPSPATNSTAQPGPAMRGAAQPGPAKPFAAQSGPAQPGGVRTLLADRRWWPFLALAFAGGLASVISSNYLFAYMRVLGAPESSMGLAITLSVVSEVPVLFFGNRLVSRFGPYPVLLAAMLITGLRLLLFFFAVTPTWVLLFQLLNGLTFPLMWVAGVAYAHAHAPPNLAATAQGLFGAMVYGFGDAVGGFAGGPLFERLGGRATYILFGMIILGIVALVALLQRRASDPAAA